MRDLVILIFQSLDGVMQAPADPSEDNTGGFTQAGWARPYWDEVMAQVETEAMAAPYDMLLGRRTYEIFAESHTDGPMTDAKKYVVSTTLENPSWANTEVIKGDVPAEINRLKSEDGPLLQVHGSHGLIQTLLAHNLIDEFRLWTFPVILGSGKRLFQDGAIPADISLMKTGITDNGIVMGIYKFNNLSPK